MEELREWSKLARAIITDILEKKGGIQALLPFLCFFIVVSVVALAAYVISGKQKEVNRIAKEKAKIEDIVLENRRSSANNKSGG